MEGALEDILSLEKELAINIAESLGYQLSEAERSGFLRTVPVASWRSSPFPAGCLPRGSASTTQPLPSMGPPSPPIRTIGRPERRCGGRRVWRWAETRSPSFPLRDRASPIRTDPNSWPTP